MRGLAGLAAAVLLAGNRPAESFINLMPGKRVGRSISHHVDSIESLSAELAYGVCLRLEPKDLHDLRQSTAETVSIKTANAGEKLPVSRLFLSSLLYHAFIHRMMSRSRNSLHELSDVIKTLSRSGSVEIRSAEKKGVQVFLSTHDSNEASPVIVDLGSK